MKRRMSSQADCETYKLGDKILDPQGKLWLHPLLAINNGFAGLIGGVVTPRGKLSRPSRFGIMKFWGGRVAADYIVLDRKETLALKKFLNTHF